MPKTSFISVVQTVLYNPQFSAHMNGCKCSEGGRQSRKTIFLTLWGSKISKLRFMFLCIYIYRDVYFFLLCIPPWYEDVNLLIIILAFRSYFVGEAQVQRCQFSDVYQTSHFLLKFSWTKLGRHVRMLWGHLRKFIFTS